MQGEPLGKDCYKIRMAITSKGKGKSGGSRPALPKLPFPEATMLRCSCSSANQPRVLQFHSSKNLSSLSLH